MMHPAAIIMILAFLFIQTLAGIVLSGFGVRRLLLITTGSSAQSRGEAQTSAALVNILLAAIGLGLMGYGLWGTFRLVWGG